MSRRSWLYGASFAGTATGTPPELYPELSRLAADGLVDTTEVPQQRRTTKRVFSVNDAGRAELGRWVGEPSRPFSLKDELMVRVRSGADVDPESILTALHARRHMSVAKLDGYLTARDAMLRGRTEAQFLETTHRAGPYLTVNAGIALERAQMAWVDDPISFLNARRARPGPVGRPLGDLP